MIVYEEPGNLELKIQFLELRAKGWIYARIFRKLKVSKSTLSNWRANLEDEIVSLDII
jgi:transcriptional regulator